MKDTRHGQQYSQVIKLAQYLTGLTAQQDVWREAGKGLVNFFEVDLCAFGERKSDGTIVVSYCVTSEKAQTADWLAVVELPAPAGSNQSNMSAEIRESINETLESGFLTSRLFLTPEPLSLAFLPITHENQVIAVMLVGHCFAEPFPNELLDVYLAVAGLIGTSATRLASERELRQHRQHLAELVNERTAALTEINRQLQQEIAQRKQAEAALLSEKDNLVRIFKAMEDLIYIVNPRYEIEYMNPAFEKEFSTQNNEKCHKIISNREEICPWCNHQEVFAGNTIRSEWYCATNGKTYDSIRTPLKNADGTISMLAIFRDISERVRMEEQLRQQDRLAAVGQLAAGIAHDFNNILTSILGFTELLRTSPTTPDTMQSDLQRISDSSQRAAALVRQLLDFSRKTVRQPERIDLSAFIADILNLLKSTMPENIQLTLQVESNDYRLEADPTQLQQVITNLAMNAREAMPTGGQLQIGLARVNIVDAQRCMVCNQPIVGEWLKLTVTDSGSGIAAEMLPRIFEPFFTTKEVGQGSGLGLSQVSGIVEQHRGHIRIESRIGEGTTVTLYLPPLAAKNNRPKTEAPQIRQGQGETILLVEDETTVLEVTAAMLKHLGYQVLAVSEGEEAIAVFEAYQEKIAIVLSDMVMPDMDGETLFQRLSAKNPHLKMVIMSGYPLGERGAKLLEQGIVDWFQKPMSFEQLSQAVSKGLSLSI